MPELIIKRDKHYLFILRKDIRKFIRFNLQTKILEARNNSLQWKEVTQQYKFFQNCRISDITCKEQKFSNLIKMSKEYNPSCNSLSTFFIRLTDVLIYEQYIDNNINVRPDYNYRRTHKIYKHILHPLSDYNKKDIKLFRESGITIDLDFERSFFQNKEFNQKVTEAILLLDINKTEKKKLLESVITGYRSDNFRSMILESNYDMKALFRYLVEYLQPFENVEYEESIRLLRDYYRMAKEIGRDVKKYPKYLKSMHDIIMANYDSYKKEYDEMRFSQLQNKDLEYKGKIFSIILPNNSKDIIAEGTNLNHCVASYVARILDGKCLIIFLRKTETLDTSLITVEVIDKSITQARGSYNRGLVEEEMKFLENYAKEKHLKLEI